MLPARVPEAHELSGPDGRRGGRDLCITVPGVSGADDTCASIMSEKAVVIVPCSLALARALLLIAALLGGRAGWVMLAGTGGLPWPWSVFGLAIVLAPLLLLAILAGQSFRIDGRGIERRGLFGATRLLPWDEVRRITLRRINSSMREVIISGHWQRLAYGNGLLTPWVQRKGFWPGTRLLVELARRHDIPVKGPGWVVEHAFWDLDPDDQRPPIEPGSGTNPL